MSNLQNTEAASHPHLSQIDFKAIQDSNQMVILRSPKNNILTRESTMATSECVIPENSSGGPINPLEQVEIAHIPSERSQRSFDDNIFPEAQPSPHAVYKSTLANLSDGLATLNEGEYVQWDNCNEQKGLQNVVLSQKSIGISGRKQRPMSVHMYAPPGVANYSRTETPNKMNISQHRSVINKANTKIMRNVVIGDIDIVLRRNYDSVVPSHQSRAQIGNDFRWKESGSLNQDLEVLKTEETLETVKKINKDYIECTPVIITNDKYQRSSSVKNRRPLTREFEEWKVVLMQRKEALAEKKELLKKEKEKAAQQQDAKKEDMVLPKLNIGGENIKSPVKREKEKDSVQATNRLSAMRKTKLNWGGGKPGARKKSLNIHIKENRENIIDKSYIHKDLQESQGSGKQKNTPEIKNILRSKGSASVVILDEEALLQNVIQKYQEEDRPQNEHENPHSNKYKQNGLVPKMKIKQDVILKKQTFMIQKRAQSRAESRERSRERSTEVKYDVEKVLKGFQESSNRIGLNAYYSCGNEALTENCSAQTILDQRLKTLEERYGKKEESHMGRAQTPSLEHRRFSRNSLGGNQEGSRSKGREEGGKITKINFVINLNKKQDRSMRHLA